MKRELTADQIQKLNEAKKHMCWELRRAMARSGESLTILAYKMGTCKSCVLEVQCGQVERLTFNQLFRYLVRMQPHFQFLVSI